jgi:hypothetical protein
MKEDLLSWSLMAPILLPFSGFCTLITQRNSRIKKKSQNENVDIGRRRK